MTTLEKAALDGHKQGLSWHDWWTEHGEAVKAAAPFDNRRLRKLVNRLAHILLTGERSGQFPPDDPDAVPQWEVDDQLERDRIDDSTTAARLQMPLPFGREGVTP